MQIIPRRVIRGILHKRCGHCKQYKPYTDFALDNSKKIDHLQGTCKECHKYYLREYRKEEGNH